MTVGEKIQIYRKKFGLSQEELGQKMLVSRQTVSLWEMDKTLPTVDNLLRLKEIFSVSIDEILSDEEPIEAPAERPKESYTFQYNKIDLKAAYKHAFSPILKKMILFALLGAFLFIGTLSTDTSEFICGLVGGYILLGMISYGKGYLQFKKSWKDVEFSFLESTYFYDIYDNYFILNISRKNDIKKTFKIDFDDIEKVHSLENHLFLQASEQSYIIKKDILATDSILRTLRNKTPVKRHSKELSGKLKAASILLFVLSIATIWGSLFGVAILSAFNPAMTENMWVFFLFLPIPIASICLGFYLKKKGYKYKKNVIVGFIMAALLCIYGSFSFLFADVYTHDDTPILKAEELLSIDIPTHSKINTQDWTKGTQSTTRGYIYSTSDIYFEDDAVEEFEKNLKSDAKWISNIPNDMIGITSYFCEIYTDDDYYYIIYNVDTKEFNQLPSESGSYRFINVLYDMKDNTMRLVEYQIEYNK